MILSTLEVHSWKQEAHELTLEAHVLLIGGSLLSHEVEENLLWVEHVALCLP